jgi:hypothetical protein
VGRVGWVGGVVGWWGWGGVMGGGMGGWVLVGWSTHLKVRAPGLEVLQLFEYQDACEEYKVL